MSKHHGTGSIITRPGTRNLYIRYYVDGVQRQEAVGSSSREEAQRMLNERLGNTQQGAVSPADIKKLTYENLRDEYVRHRPGENKDYKWQFLNKFFGRMRVSDISSDTIERFIEHRRDVDKVTDPTIRRNLNPLRAAFRYAAKKRKLGLRDVPWFPMPEDSDAAGVYIEPSTFAKIVAALPVILRPFFTFIYGTGCRLGAAQRIVWSMVSKDCDVLTLPGEIVKSRKPLTIVLDGPQLAPIAAMLRKMFRSDAPVFDSTNYRPEWSKACAKAGVGTWDAKARTRTGVRIHDCRCSAAINLLDSGVHESLVLKIGGWKTRAMLDRYNREDVNRLRAAMRQSGEYVAARMNGAKA